MDGDAITGALAGLGVVPVVIVDDAAWAEPLAAALLAGGLPVAEVTFRTDAAADAIAAIRRTHPDVLVGAGTVLDVATVNRALEAGASFIVAPGFNPEVVDACLARAMPVIPGVATPTEIEAGLARGLRLLKLFPAEALGGRRYLTAIAAPYRGVRFMPTGGVNPDNLADYLALPQVAACGGTWIATTAAMRAGRWAQITALAAEAVALVGAARP
jgi:2-dehydro-3-deoxyphosphogluconate aldolase/(4S)-4-hydroxy-2-oxoglutarate aldolase